MMMKQAVRLFISALVVALVGCSDDSAITETVIKAAQIESGDTCHLCGMVILDFAGPKGELVMKGDTEARKFCSNLDMFSFYLQPENQHRATELYVHDMAISPWESSDDDHFMTAQDAWYVFGSNKTVAMGPSLASFSEEAAAKEFMTQFGGEMYQFKDINLELLNSDRGLNDASGGMTMPAMESTKM